MSIIIKEREQKEVLLIPAGTYNAVCYNIWDLGYQEVIYMGKSKIVDQVVIGWEIDELIPSGDYQGKRFTKTKTYTKSLYEKATLCKDLQAWRGVPFTDAERAEFDIEDLVGKPCMISLIHKQSKDGKKTYVNISSVTRLPKSMAAITPENERTTPKWIETKIAEQVPKPEAEEVQNHEEPIPF